MQGMMEKGILVTEREASIQIQRYDLNKDNKVSLTDVYIQYNPLVHTRFS